jgi:hypothetical protein
LLGIDKLSDTFPVWAIRASVIERMHTVDMSFFIDWFRLNETKCVIDWKDIKNSENISFYKIDGKIFNFAKGDLS